MNMHCICSATPFQSTCTCVILLAGCCRYDAHENFEEEEVEVEFISSGKIGHRM